MKVNKENSWEQDIQAEKVLKYDYKDFKGIFENLKINATYFNLHEKTAIPKEKARILLEEDNSCPPSDLYVNWIEAPGTPDQSYQMVDMLVRDFDLKQFYTGTFYETGGKTECILATINREGINEKFTYLSNQKVNNEWSKCNALEMNQQNDLFVVGSVSNGVRTSALIMMMSSDLESSNPTPLMKIWSYSSDPDGNIPNQEAHDVATTTDGAIFVTGFVSNAFSRGQRDCFLLKLNYTLEVIYARTFGTSTDHEECYQVQVTRMYDFIYLAGLKYTPGSSKTQMTFYKFDGYLNNGISTSILPQSNEVLSLKRLIITKKRSFSGTNDNNYLYFCGSTTANNGDVIIGRITSNALSSISISEAYRYGSPHAESLGDCAMTEDNSYLIVLMNTKHYVDRRTYTVSSAQPISTDFTYPNPVDPQLPDPYEFCNNGNGANSCTLITDVDRLMGSTLQAVRNYCINTAKDEIINYQDDYLDEIYSWTTCNYFVYNFNAIRCIVNSVQFRRCDNFLANGNPCYRFSNGVNSVCHDCQPAIDLIMNQAPWFRTCRNDEFKEVTWQSLIQAYKPSNQEYNLASIMFCEKYSTYTGGALSNNYCNYDYFNFVYEQDCKDDANRGSYYNWYIMKFDLSQFDVSYIDSMPQEASYFGARDGDTVGLTLAVDQHGFIYLSGYTLSSALGGSSPEKVWLYARIHWNLNWELKIQQSGASFTNPTNYLGKRFIKPNKFNNNHNPSNPSTGATYDFNYDYLTESTQPTVSTTAYLVNEQTSSLSSFSYTSGLSTIQYHTYDTTFISDKGLSATRKILGTSYVSQGNIPTITLAKDANQNVVVRVPSICHFKTNGADSNDQYRDQYSKAKYSAGTQTTGLSFVLDSTDSSSAQYLYGLASGSEGIYYTYFQGDSYSFDWDFTSANPDYECPADYYRFFHDSDDYAALRRFMIAQRLKIIVDDLKIFPPENKEDIPDVEPIIGQRYEHTISGYFTTTCSYYMAKQAKLLNNTSSSTAYNSTQLPYWMLFYESNMTFVMYPNDMTEVSIDVYCCNSIDQCAINTFKVTPKDNSPTNTYGSSITPFIVHYDAYEDVGEYFAWAKTNIYFQDEDEATSDSLDQSYYHSYHTVRLNFVSAFVPGFDQIKWIGETFGQAYTGNIGTQTFYYEFMSNYETTGVQDDDFSIIINQLPSPTSTGINYNFANIDNHAQNATTYFDKYFPFIKDDSSSSVLLDLLVNNWFTEPDSDSLLYSCTYSDGTDLPSYAEFDQSTGNLRVLASTEPSEMLQLKISATDPYGGTFSYYKSLLFNSKPETEVFYRSLKFYYKIPVVYDVSNFITDKDGDELEYYLANSQDLTRLRSYNLEFYSLLKRFSGTPDMIGTLSQVILEARDTHDYKARIYLTIKVRFAPTISSSKKTEGSSSSSSSSTSSSSATDSTTSLDDNFSWEKVISESSTFQFSLPNDFFSVNQMETDNDEQSALVIFVQQTNGQAIPSWLGFNPLSRTFYGIAPKVQVVNLDIRATDPESHTSESQNFRIRIVVNKNPKTVPKLMIDDLILYKGKWFEQKVQSGLFTDKDPNMYSEISLQPIYKREPPSWIQYNQDNRTLTGVPTETGLFRLELVYTDDGGLKTYQNFKIRVLDYDDPNSINNIIVHIILTISTLIALLLYVIYSIHWNIMIDKSLKNRTKEDPFRKQALERFGKHKNIEVIFHLASDGNQKNDPIQVTHNFQQYNVTERQLRKLKIIE